MAEPQLSVRSARARDLAHELAAREKRTVAQVVEQALELYKRHAEAKTPENARDFYARMRRDFGVDLDLEAVIKEGRNDRMRQIDL